MDENNVTTFCQTWVKNVSHLDKAKLRNELHILNHFVFLLVKKDHFKQIMVDNLFSPRYFRKSTLDYSSKKTRVIACID